MPGSFVLGIYVIWGSMPKSNVMMWFWHIEDFGVCISEKMKKAGTAGGKIKDEMQTAVDKC